MACAHFSEHRRRTSDDRLVIGTRETIRTLGLTLKSTYVDLFPCPPWGLIMVKAITWLLCTYLVLKLIQFVFGGQPGFREIEPGFREKLLRGEPILFAVAFTLSVPTAIWSSRYLHRGYSRGFQLSTDCYGKLRALNELPDVRRRFDAWRIYEASGAAEHVAALAGQWLKLQPDVVSKTLTDKMRFYSRQYVLLARRGDRQKLRAEAAAVERCLNESPLSL